MKSLLVAVFCIAVTSSMAAQIVDTTVCDVLANPMSFDGKMVRIKGTVMAGFDEFVVKGSSCKLPVNVIWIAYPEGSKGKAGAAAVVQLQKARNSTATVTAPTRAEVKLDRNKDFKQFDGKLSTPGWPDGGCLGCVRYTTSATLVGRLDGAKSAGLIRDKDGKVIGIDGFGNLNRYSARLVLQSVSDVVPQEIPYPKSSGPANNLPVADSGPAGDPVAAGHRAAQAFGAGSPAGDRIERAAAAFGKKGDDNGVQVDFGATNEVPKGEGTKGQHDSPDGLLFNCTFDMDRLKGNAMASAIVHMGALVSDLRDPKIAPDTSLYALEHRAWHTTVLSAIALGQKSMVLPGGYQVWSNEWSADDRGKMADEAISKFLADWLLLSDSK